MHDTLRLRALPVLLAWACGDGAPGPRAPGDTVPPGLVALSPAPGDTGVQPQARVEVTFTEPVNDATLGPASFFLMRGATPVAGAHAVDGLRAVLQPDVALDTLTIYSATLTSAVRDSAGNRLGSDTTWSFRTRGAEIPMGAGAGSCGPPRCRAR